MPERKLGFFVKIKKDENFKHRHTLSISRINPPKFGGGLKFESDPREIGSAFHGAGTDIGEKDRFRSGTNYYILIDSSMRNRDRERSLASGGRGPDPDAHHFHRSAQNVVKMGANLAMLLAKI